MRYYHHRYYYHLHHHHYHHHHHHHIIALLCLRVFLSTIRSLLRLEALAVLLRQEFAAAAATSGGC
jgi:hypothetical protein